MTAFGIRKNMTQRIISFLIGCYFIGAMLIGISSGRVLGLGTGSMPSGHITVEGDPAQFVIVMAIYLVAGMVFFRAAIKG